MYLYLLQRPYYYVGKDDEIYSELMSCMIMLVSEKTESGDRVRMLNLCAENDDPFNFTCNAQYYDTVFNQNYRSGETTLFSYQVAPASGLGENTAATRINPHYVLQGKLRQDTFVGDATYYFGGSQLNAAGTELVPVTDGDKISLVLTEEGGLYIDAMGLLEYNNEKPNDIFVMLEIYENDPTIPGYVFNYEQYSVVELRCDNFGQSNSKYWAEVPTYDVKFFSTDQTIEYWRLLQTLMK